MELRNLEKEYKIHVYETGPDGKLNLFSLFDFLQDIASEHAVRLGFGRDDLMKENHFWVLSRIYAVISIWPKWEDTIVIRTWHKGTDKLFGMRDFEAFFPDGRPIASAASSWLIVDRSTKKIQRPDKILTDLFPVPPKNALPRNAAKLEQAVEDGIILPDFRVKISDLDINLHTNNVRYLKWVTDTYDLDFSMKNVIWSAEINYLAESVYNDEITIRKSVGKDDKTLFDHSIFRKNDNKELCRIRLCWKDNIQTKVD
jgi:medium-chain acyl-[acyl-carrier-protein] hydrolase